MLFAYWDAVRGERAAPERADLRPAGLRHVLADAFVLATDRTGTARFKLAGTRVSSLACRDLTGRTFRSLWPSHRQNDADDLVAPVLTETIGLVAGLNGVNENGSELPLELVLLPVRHRARMQAQLIGALSPAYNPSWAGLVPIAAVEIRSVRMIQPRRPADGNEPDEIRPGSIGRRSLFVVHAGGRP